GGDEQDRRGRVQRLLGPGTPTLRQACEVSDMPHYDGRVRGPGTHLRRAGEDSPIQEPGYDIEFRILPM
ncbi:MAG: hypothetical protein MUO50_11605, partial [Longimicrobiales bacterium]|nr:hypothetical protein [Longimicrobiales bacterium]